MYVFGPGHNSFTVSPLGQYDILVYHGRDYEFIDGDPLNDPNRHTRVQAIDWTAEGTPVFGPPVRDVTRDRGQNRLQPSHLEGQRPGVRLVEDQQVRRFEQCARQQHAAFHPTG